MKQKPRGRVTGGDGDTVCKKNIFQFANFGQVLFVLVFKKKSHTDHRLHLNSKGYFYFICFRFQTLVTFLLVLIIKKKSYADHRLPLNSKAYFLIFSFSDCKLWSGFCWYFKTKKSYTDHRLHLNSKHIYLKLSWGCCCCQTGTCHCNSIKFILAMDCARMMKFPLPTILEKHPL